MSERFPEQEKSVVTVPTFRRVIVFATQLLGAVGTQLSASRLARASEL
jgi:hypothetical protein